MISLVRGLAAGAKILTGAVALVARGAGLLVQRLVRAVVQVAEAIRQRIARFARHLHGLLLERLAAREQDQWWRDGIQPPEYNPLFDGGGDAHFMGFENDPDDWWKRGEPPPEDDYGVSFA